MEILNGALALLNTPLGGAAAALGVMLMASRFPVLGTLLGKVITRLRTPAPAAPPAPPTVPVPESDPSPEILPNRPILNAALKHLREIAARMFPHLSPDEALERHVISQAHYAYYDDDQKREAAKQVEEPAAK